MTILDTTKEAPKFNAFDPTAYQTTSFLRDHSMRKFDELAANIENVDSLSKATSEDIKWILERIPNVDNDYIEFLENVGYGNLGDIQLYNGVIDSDEIYPSPQDNLDDVLLFGDDMQGYCFGFKLDEGMRVVEIDPKGQLSQDVKPTFVGLMKVYLG